MAEDAPRPEGSLAGGDTMAAVAGTTDLPPGAIVGEYRIEGVVGRGGMGTIYAALQPVIEKKVAIKVLAAPLSSRPDLVRRFVDEARAVNRIGHENIVDIFSFGQLPDGRQYFVMEFLEGATLGQRLERGDLPPEQVPTLLAQIFDALEAAHEKKIIHRDLKPENIWIGTSSRGLPRVRLLDFGIAKLLDTGDGMSTDVGAVMGTPQFMSPEQCNGRGVDHRTDIYAMGVIMYRLYAGQLPFTGTTFAEILGKQITEMPPAPSTLAAVPDGMDSLIMRCLDKDPAGRPQSAAALSAELAAIVPIDSGGHSAGHSLEQRMTAAVARGPGGAKAATPAVGLSATEVPRAAALPGAQSRVVVMIAVAGIVIAALAVGLTLLRSSPASRASASAPAAAPAEPRPVTPSIAAPVAAPAPVPPAAAVEAAPLPAAEPTRRRPAAESGVAAKRPAPPEEKPAKGEKTDTPRPSSRASRTGLVTDNPFE